METNPPYVILFDGVCNFCNRWVLILIKFDKKAIFQFSAMQNEVGQKYVKTYNLEKFDSVIYIEHGQVYTESDAVLKITYRLGGFWRMLLLFYIIPKPLRNFLYRWVAKNRYRFFGKREVCSVPTPEIRGRFLAD